MEVSLNSYVPSSISPSTKGSAYAGISSQVPLLLISRTTKSGISVVVADTGAARGTRAEASIIRQILIVLVFLASLSLYM